MACTTQNVQTANALQWGHGIAAVESGRAGERGVMIEQCFNGATALLPWNPWVATPMSEGGLAASMGPRHCCRGISGLEEAKAVK